MGGRVREKNLPQPRGARMQQLCNKFVLDFWGGAGWIGMAVAGGVWPAASTPSRFFANRSSTSAVAQLSMRINDRLALATSFSTSARASQSWPS